MKFENQKIIPNLWFDHEAEEAVNFYNSLFENSGIDSSSNYPEAGKEIHQQEPGSVMTLGFHLAGYKLMALNGGPHFKLNPSVSLFVLGLEEEEINRIWDQLVKGGTILLALDSYDWSPKYGWLQDRYGLSWQFMFSPDQNSVQKICPLLFFTGDRHGMAEAAVRYYTSIFKNSGIEGILKYSEEDKNEYALNKVKHAQFKLEGETFMAMDSGVENNYPFNEAASFIVTCQTQEEIDYYWEKLGEEGDLQAQQCGWLKDKFGVSWQIVPEGMEKFFNDPDKDKVNRAMDAMMKMKKIDMKMLTQE